MFFILKNTSSPSYKDIIGEYLAFDFEIEVFNGVLRLHATNFWMININKGWYGLQIFWFYLIINHIMLEETIYEDKDVLINKK